MSTKKALILSANDFEDTELLVPYYRLLEAGFTVDVASDKGSPIRGKHGYEVPVSKVFNELSQDQYSTYDLLLLPGGKAPAAIRNNQRVQEITRYFMNEKKPVAAICHGPQILISSGVIRGRNATCYKTVVTELREAAAQYQDTEVIVDGNLVTSREPRDLPAFCREIMNLLGEQGQQFQQGQQLQQGQQSQQGQQQKDEQQWHKY
ncbi:type 1 glutamine amidotransferase domain-containing protein [Geomonas sp.]|uniref:type 1 glutamine amidotransferase domain-containing protein n=1 Tax=Geomonas sp. TaxID=2651584 RepID=UPI002B47EA74|nr:type 1 glutamine amidotransferase domain-containing protein [Geomonas sp.]HJV34701.1 type 1 glutamine amidotransferase domain-containing protein [Geomonas sp.]